MEGIRIGRYLLESRLPRTGAAEAYRAVQSGGENVVVKLYPPGLRVDAPRVERIAEMLAMLGSPVIAPTYEAGLWEGRFYTVTQYLPGGSLAERLRARGTLPPDEAARILYTLTLGLSGMHALGIHHLNIKPENILFDAEGAPCLTDFAITRFALYTPSDSLAVNVQDVRYLSPEQILDSGEAGAPGDIYALGAVYHAMLTGQPPHGPQRDVEAALIHLTQAEQPLRALKGAGLPSGAQRILRRTLAPAPAARFASAEDLEEALNGLLPAPERTDIRTRAGVRAVNLPPSSARSGKRRMPSWAKSAGIALLFVLAIALGALAALWQQGALLPVQTAASTAVAAVPLPAASVTPSPSAAPSPTPTFLPTATATPAAVSNPVVPAASPTPPLVLGGADKIAFLAQDDIWIANLDGSDLQRLTTDEEPKEDLRWAPDGQSVTYTQAGVRKAVDLSGARVAPREDESAHRCTFFLERYEPRMVRYAPNERFVAAVVEVSLHGRKEDVIQVFEFDADCQPHKVDEFPADRFTMRGYSGANEQAALDEYAWNGLQLFALHGNVRHDGGDLVVYNLETKTAETYAPVGNCCYRDIRWSPDGQYLLFAFQDVRYTDPARLYYVPFGTLGQQQKYEPLPFPEYFFDRIGGRIYPVLRPYRPPATPTPQPETQNAAAPLEVGGADKLALLRDNAVWMFNLDGSGGVQLTDGSEEKRYLRWSPDGMHVLFQTAQCLKAVNIATQEVLSLGCYDAAGISLDGTRIAIRDDVLFPDGLYRPLASVAPFNMQVMQAFPVFTSLPLLGACPLDILADLYRWSPDGTRLAVLSETSAAGRKEQAVEVFELRGCREESNLLTTFPGTHFSLRGYSEPEAEPLLYDFAWNGGDLFAVNGNVRDGFGDLVLFDQTTARETLLDPLGKECCYREMRWSPDGSYFFFTTEAPGRNIELYYVPFNELTGQNTLAPLALPADFFARTDPRKRIYPALRPVLRQVNTQYGLTPEATDSLVVLAGGYSQNLLPPGRGIYALAMSPDGAFLAVGDDSDIALYSPDGTRIRTFAVGGERHTDFVTGAAFSADGSWLASASVDSTVRVWRVETGALYQKYDMAGYPVLDLAYDPLDDYVATAAGDGVGRVNRIKNAGLRYALSGHTGPLLAVAYAADGSMLMTGSLDGTARIWSAGDGGVLQVLSGHLAPVRDVAFSPDGSLAATASWDGTVRVWRVRSGELLYTLGHTHPVWSVAFSPDGQWLVSGDTEGVLKVWRLADGAQVQMLDSGRGVVTALVFSPGGTTMYAGSADGQLLRYTVNSNQ